MITIATISILVIAFLAWIANRFLPLKICPICAGVFGTWVWLVAGSLLGYQIDPVIPALLMGGSVVGVAYRAEKRSSLLWKMLFIPAGFIAAYGILNKEWLISLIAVLFLLGITLIFSSSKEKSKQEETIEKLKQKMDKCC